MARLSGSECLAFDIRRYAVAEKGKCEQSPATRCLATYWIRRRLSAHVNFKSLAFLVHARGIFRFP
jgi:hypothetical protein